MCYMPPGAWVSPRSQIIGPVACHALSPVPGDKHILATSVRLWNSQSTSVRPIGRGTPLGVPPNVFAPAQAQAPGPNVFPVAETREEAETGAKLLGEAKFATPVVVTEMTQGFNMAFQINQGATIWDEDGGVGDYSIGVGSGPFMVIITPVNY